MWKLECPDLRNLQEQNGYSLTDPRHLLYPKKEYTCIQSEIQGKYLPVTIGTTSRLGEVQVLAIVVTFTSDWNIDQWLVPLQVFQKSLNSEELAKQLYLVHSQLHLALRVTS